MIDGFTNMDPQALNENAFKLIGSDWMLITAGTPESFNTMTASWGWMGIMWNKPVAISVIRPQRYTYEFIEKSENYTLTFFPEEYRSALNLCGTKSGRDVDKVKETGLTPAVTDSGAVYFEEARIVLACRKLYHQDIDPKNFADPEIDKMYPIQDYHRMYFGEIVGCFVKQGLGVGG